MTYYVLATDGNRYGPTDLDTLNLWAMEGRVIPASQIEEVGTGRRVPAHEIVGLTFPATKNDTRTQDAYPTSIPVHPGYYRGPQYGPQYGSQYDPQYAQQNPYGYVKPPGSANVTTAWILGSSALGILCVSVCCFLGFIISFICSVIGVVLSCQAKQQDHPSAQAPLIFNVVVLVLSVLGGIGYIIFMFSLMTSTPSSSF
jgi:hypothetical protein